MRYLQTRIAYIAAGPAGLATYQPLRSSSRAWRSHSRACVRARGDFVASRAAHSDQTTSGPLHHRQTQLGAHPRSEHLFKQSGAELKHKQDAGASIDKKISSLAFLSNDLSFDFNAVDGGTSNAATQERVGVFSLTETDTRHSRHQDQQAVQDTGVLIPQMQMASGPGMTLLIWEVGMVVALLMLLRAGVSKTLRWIHARVTRSGLRDKSDSDSIMPYEQSVLECIQRPLELVAVITVATIAGEAVARSVASATILRLLQLVRELGVIAAGAWFVMRWIERLRARLPVERGIDRAQADTTARLGSVAVAVGTALVALDAAGINIQAVLAFGGLGGITLGFAGRDIISNFFGGFMIYITRPFAVGDWVRAVEAPELDGTVEDVGWYRTRVVTWDKRPLYIPNARFSTLIVENASRMTNRRISHVLDVRLEDIPVLSAIVDELVELLSAHPELDPRQHRMAFVDGFGAYSAKIWFSCYTKSVFLSDFRRLQQEILLAAYNIIRKNGARLATTTTRDVRPGIDVDRYGPYGAHASFGRAAASSEASDAPTVTRVGSPSEVEVAIATSEVASPIQQDEAAKPDMRDQTKDMQQLANSMSAARIDTDSTPTKQQSKDPPNPPNTMKISAVPKLTSQTATSSQVAEVSAIAGSDGSKNSSLQDTSPSQ